MSRLRKMEKKKMITLLDESLRLHNQILNHPAEDFTELLELCQEWAIWIGETLEKAVPEQKEIVAELENYCESVYQLSIHREGAADRLVVMNRQIEEIREQIRRFPAVWQIVFMPYKSSMWDSLESVWLACRQDKDCECLVVVLPYFQFDREQEKLIPCYEGADFPEYVSVTGYEDYHMEIEKPDVVFVHNPYDDQNLVTTIHPAYYSGELKKYAGKLVYIPYYVTTGVISQEHLNLPVYQNMDYMIVQSELFKSGCKGMNYYDKIQVLGSPKLDRIIRMTREKAKVPDEWNSVIGQRKKILLNTSINGLLSEGEIYLDKLKRLFRMIAEKKKVAIIWRPHPLLEATIKSLRPHLAKQYEELKAYFCEEEIGVLDHTPDITPVIAYSDAYMGDGGTSLINLFGAAGKPIFLFNNAFYKESDNSSRKRLSIQALAECGGRYWVTLWNCNALFSMKQDFTDVHLEGRTPGAGKWCTPYPSMESMDNFLFFAPNITGMPIGFDTVRKNFYPLLDQRLQMDMRCWQVAVYKSKIFYLPQANNMLMECDIRTGAWNYDTECIVSLKKGNRDLHFEDVYAYEVSGQFLWMTTTYSNRILKYNMESGAWTVYDIGEEDNSYSGIALDDPYVWLAETKRGTLVRWNRLTGEITCFEMPEEFQTWQHISGRSLAHAKIFNMGHSVITVPAFSNGMVKVNKDTKEAVLLMPDFWKDASVPVNGYHPRLLPSAGFAKKLPDGTILVQRNSDDRMIKIADGQDGGDTFLLEMPRQDYRTLLDGQDGFEKVGIGGGFYQAESRFFSAEHFLNAVAEDGLEDVKKRQKEELEDLAVNLDGTCGEKVHAFIKSVLEQEVRGEND